MNEKWVIYVVEKTAELRNVKISQILDEEYIPKISNKSNFIGFNDDIKFINWYDNRDYIKTWKTKQEAQSFLDFLLDNAHKYYKTWKDPFRGILKTKGDWKDFYFVVIKLD
jgi:hypothetical protein